MPESYHRMRPVLEIQSFLLRWLRLRWKRQQTALHVRIIHDTDSLRQPLNKHTSIYTRSTTFVSKLSKKSKLLSLRKKKNPSEPVMKHTSSSFWALDSTHIWLCLGAKFSRSLQGQQMTPNKNSLGNLSRSRKGNKTAGRFTPNGSSETPTLIFLSQYEANVQNRPRANCPFPKASKSGCQRISHASQKDLVCHSPLLWI